MKTFLNLNQTKKRLLFCFGVTFVIGLIGYAFAFFNPSTSVDSASLNMAWEREHQYVIGRIFQPIYRNVTSIFHSPFLSGVFWLVFLSLAIFYLAEIFSLRKLFIVFTSAILTLSACFIKTTGYYPQWNEIYSLCLLLAVLSVYLLKKYKYGIIGFGLLNVLVLGLYQSYVCVSIGLVAVLAVFDLIKGETLKKVIINTLIAAVVIVVSFIVYFVLYKIILKVLNLSANQAYNSTGGIFSISITRLPVLFVKSYVLFFRNLVLFSDYQEVGLFNGFIAPQEIFAVLLAVFSIGLSIYYFIKLIKIKNLSVGVVIVSVCITLLIPFAFACICVVSNGNGLMNMYLQNLLVYLLPMFLYTQYSATTEKTVKYSLKQILIVFVSLFVVELCFVGVWLFKFKDNQTIKSFVCQFLIAFIIPIYMLITSRKQEDKTYVGKSFIKLLVVFLSCGLIFNSVVFANQTHIKVYQDSQRRLVNMTLVVEKIENCDDYEQGMEVVIYGDIGVVGGSWNGSVKNYLSAWLNKSYNLVEYNNDNQVLTEDEINNEIKGDKMACFPNKDCVKKIGDKLVLKLSE